MKLAVNRESKEHSHTYNSGQVVKWFSYVWNFTPGHYPHTFRMNLRGRAILKINSYDKQ